LTFFEVVAPVETSPRAFPNVRDLAETSSGTFEKVSTWFFFRKIL
jgi:hypothetical protein